MQPVFRSNWNYHAHPRHLRPACRRASGGDLLLAASLHRPCEATHPPDPSPDLALHPGRWRASFGDKGRGSRDPGAKAIVNEVEPPPR